MSKWYPIKNIILLSLFFEKLTSYYILLYLEFITNYFNNIFHNKKKNKCIQWFFNLVFGYNNLYKNMFTFVIRKYIIYI